ncbi:MAG: orotidine-5'-phosphate decarboxylase, partial [Desulfobulbaceae bacterium]|nr:orotidine-5'-phosphate decarboxylase [Desulfobulbaceae bacterium]
MNKKNIPLNERIIFALDFSSTDEAKQWVRRVESHIKFYKVGLQLFLAGWFPIIEWIIDRGHKVMVDLKFFDVPETVKLAVEQLQNRGITFATIHGNDPIVRAAVKEKGDLKLLAVTVLTSFGENDMKEMGLQCSVEDLVFHRAKQALDIGCDGVVSSGLEAARLRERLGEKFLIITPGIRPGKNIEVKEDDQVRIMTAEKAIKNGADHVVIGRPIKT